MKNFIKTFILIAILIVASFAVVGSVSAAIDDNSGTGCSGCGDTTSGSTGGSDGGDDYTPPETPTCDLTLNKLEVTEIGEAYRLTWEGGPSSATFYINGSQVPDSGAANFTFTGPNYDRFRMVGNNGGVTCEAEVRITMKVSEPPSCDLFTATPGALPVGGGDVTLTWESTDATNAKIDGQSVAGNGSMVVSNVTSDRTFTLTLDNAYGSDTCTATVTVPTSTPLPSCDSFTAAPTTLPVGGGNVTLAWQTTNATAVKLDGATVAVDGSKVVNVTATKTFILTVEGTNGSDSCTAKVTVDTTTTSTPSCDAFTASPTSLSVGGGNVTLTWNTTNADTVSIDNGVGEVADDGSMVVNVTATKTYVLTVSNVDGADTCSATVTVATRSTGGGSSSPRCTLKVSDDKISLGDEVTLTWTTTRVDEVTLKDNHGNILIDASDDNDDLDGSMKVRPTKDTEYTLYGERGSRDVDCDVEVEVKDNFTLTQVRNQFPIAGISLTQVPYTGFEAGPVLTTIFYSLLTLWGLFVAYVIAVRRDVFGGVSFAGAHDHVAYTDVSSDAQTDISPAEEYVAAVTETVPANLPTGIAPVVGYASREAEVMTDEEADASIEMSELENRAHLQHTLFSSDAMRYFTKVTPVEGRESALDLLIARAKAAFPIEDGWLVINLARLETLLETDGMEAVIAASPVTPGNGGSLAEAIVTGNVVAAFQLIAHRPMIALADAAAELDAILRTRKGVTAVVSDMLARETVGLTDTQLQAAIVALTGALDGVYTTEEEAVKMAIMKAVKAVA